MVLRLPDSWSNWNLEMLAFEEGENQSTRRKTSRSKGENQQQTQPTYGVDAGIWTRATLVGGECSHHCATLAPNKIVICCNVTGLKLKLCVNSFQTFPRLICLQQHYYSVKSKLCQGRLLATYVNRKWTPWFLGQWFCLMFWKYCLYKSKDT